MGSVVGGKLKGSEFLAMLIMEFMNPPHPAVFRHHSIQCIKKLGSVRSRGTPRESFKIMVALKLPMIISRIHRRAQ